MGTSVAQTLDPDASERSEQDQNRLDLVEELVRERDPLQALPRS